MQKIEVIHKKIFQLYQILYQIDSTNLRNFHKKRKDVQNHEKESKSYYRNPFHSQVLFYCQKDRFDFLRYYASLYCRLLFKQSGGGVIPPPILFLPPFLPLFK